MALNDNKIKGFKATGKTQTFLDSGNLYMTVDPKGNKG